MKCSEHDFLSIRKKSCLELDDGQFIVKVGLISNLNYLLDFLKQEQNKTSDDSYMDVDSNLTFDLINKNPLLKNLVLWYQRIGSEGVTNTDKNGFLIDFINTITNNLTKSGNHFRYSDKIKYFALSLYILGGKLAYEFIRLNILGSLPAYGIDNTATVNDILKRWWYIFNQCLQRNIRIIDSAAGEKLANSSTPTSFYSKIKITLVLFFLREQQLSLFFQDATHLATKWRNRLLSSTTELRLGDQSISIDHLPAYLSVELNAHNLLYLILLVQQKQLTPQSFHIHTFSSQACESIFPNTRALSGVYSTIVNFTIHDFLRRAQRLSLLNDIKYKHLNDRSVNNLVFPVHYKHRYDHQSLATQSQREVDLIDVEQIITESYHEAIDMLNGLGILNLLNDKNVLGLKPLSEYIFKQLNSNSKMYEYSPQLNQTDDGEFEVADDDDDDDDEQGDTRNLITTTKQEFSGMKVFNTVQSHIEHSYFKATINDDIKYMHKQTACWLLTGEKSIIVGSVPVKYNIFYYGLIADCPALALILNFINHTEYFCCFYCFIRGQHDRRCRKRQYIYPDTVCTRDPTSFNNHSQSAESNKLKVYGHRGRSILDEAIDVPLPHSIICDYQHVT
ncbi:unnamed protein product [Rotaria magnacalcarata]